MYILKILLICMYVLKIFKKFNKIKKLFYFCVSVKFSIYITTIKLF